jgi:hypothetical protein
METSKIPVRSPVNPAKAEQTLVEFIQTIELPPLPSPPKVQIIDVLASIYGEHPIIPAPVVDKPEVASEKMVAKEETECVADCTRASEQPLADSIQNPAISDTAASQIGFKLALIAAIVSFTGWLNLLILLEETSVIILFLSLEFLALCFSIASLNYTPDRSATTKLRVIGFALSIGWLPLIALVAIGWPVFFVVAFAFAIWFLFRLADDEKDESLNLQN